MPPKHIVEALKRFPVLPYLDEVNANGRGAIDRDTRLSAVSLYDLAEGVLCFQTALDRGARSTLALVKNLLFAEKFLSENTEPRYVAYTNLLLLDRYLLEGKSATLDRKWMAAKRALALIVADWHEREQDRLTDYTRGAPDTGLLGYEKKAARDPIAHIKERERSLDSLAEFSAVQGLPDVRIIRNDVLAYATDWEYFAAAPAKQIAHLACMPRSRWHDEYMFLRTIHATECCFEGILAALATLPPIVRKRDFSAATEILKGSLFFSDFLTKLFTIFPTMPVEHFFAGFRAATGQGSAIQSVRFQTIEVLTRGLGATKRTALSHQQEAGFASCWKPPEEATLAGMCAAARIAGTDGEEFLEIASHLDRDLFQWRAKHLGIARRYLPASSPGTGNEGVSYLEANYDSPRSFADCVGQVSQSDANPDRQPARCTLSFDLRKHRRPAVAVFRVNHIERTRVGAGMAGLKTLLDGAIAERDEHITKSIKGYKDFFEGRVYPVERQLQSFRRKGVLSTELVPALLLSLELQSGSLFGVHETSRVNGQIIFDTASADESFTGITGKLVKCTCDEPIMRDEHGIIASIFQGPDNRTVAVLPKVGEESSWTFTLFGYPGMPATSFALSIADARVAFALIGAIESTAWISYER
jgi:tryptophan 2,3-dioxygenase